MRAVSLLKNSGLHAVIGGDCGATTIAGSRWRLRDVGEAHHGNPSRGCEGTIYHQGEIDGRGRLAGLPEEFESSYGYDGYMEIQQGCVRKDGSVEWPCPNG